jgi:hypothetical protein
LGENPQEDIEATSASFMDSFIGANPKGAGCWQNNEQRRTAIFQGNAFIGVSVAST